MLHSGPSRDSVRAQKEDTKRLHKARSGRQPVPRTQLPDLKPPGGENKPFSHAIDALPKALDTLTDAGFPSDFPRNSGAVELQQLLPLVDLYVNDHYSTLSLLMAAHEFPVPPALSITNLLALDNPVFASTSDAQVPKIHKFFATPALSVLAHHSSCTKFLIAFSLTWDLCFSSPGFRAQLLERQSRAHLRFFYAMFLLFVRCPTVAYSVLLEMPAAHRHTTRPARAILISFFLVPCARNSYASLLKGKTLALVSRSISKAVFHPNLFECWPRGLRGPKGDAKEFVCQYLWETRGKQPDLHLSVSVPAGAQKPSFMLTYKNEKDPEDEEIEIPDMDAFTLSTTSDPSQTSSCPSSGSPQPNPRVVPSHWEDSCDDDDLVSNSMFDDPDETSSTTSDSSDSSEGLPPPPPARPPPNDSNDGGAGGGPPDDNSGGGSSAGGPNPANPGPPTQVQAAPDPYVLAANGFRVISFQETQDITKRFILHGYIPIIKKAPAHVNPHHCGAEMRKFCVARMLVRFRKQDYKNVVSLYGAPRDLVLNASFNKNVAPADRTSVTLYRPIIVAKDANRRVDDMIETKDLDCSADAFFYNDIYNVAGGPEISLRSIFFECFCLPTGGLRWDPNVVSGLQRVMWTGFHFHGPAGTFANEAAWMDTGSTIVWYPDHLSMPYTNSPCHWIHEPGCVDLHTLDPQFQPGQFYIYWTVIEHNSLNCRIDTVAFSISTEPVVKETPREREPQYTWVDIPRYPTWSCGLFGNSAFRSILSVLPKRLVTRFQDRILVPNQFIGYLRTQLQNKVMSQFRYSQTNALLGKLIAESGSYSLLVKCFPALTSQNGLILNHVLALSARDNLASSSQLVTNNAIFAEANRNYSSIGIAPLDNESKLPLYGALSVGIVASYFLFNVNKYRFAADVVAPCCSYVLKSVVKAAFTAVKTALPSFLTPSPSGDGALALPLHAAGFLTVAPTTLAAYLPSLLKRYWDFIVYDASTCRLPIMSALLVHSIIVAPLWEEGVKRIFPNSAAHIIGAHEATLEMARPGFGLLAGISQWWKHVLLAHDSYWKSVALHACHNMAFFGMMAGLRGQGYGDSVTPEALYNGSCVLMVAVQIRLAYLACSWSVAQARSWVQSPPCVSHRPLSMYASLCSLAQTWKGHLTDPATLTNTLVSPLCEEALCHLGGPAARTAIITVELISMYNRGDTASSMLAHACKHSILQTMGFAPGLTAHVIHNLVLSCLQRTYKTAEGHMSFLKENRAFSDLDLQRVSAHYDVSTFGNHLVNDRFGPLLPTESFPDMVGSYPFSPLASVRPKRREPSPVVIDECPLMLHTDNANPLPVDETLNKSFHLIFAYNVPMHVPRNSDLLMHTAVLARLMRAPPLQPEAQLENWESLHATLWQLVSHTRPDAPMVYDDVFPPWLDHFDTSVTKKRYAAASHDIAVYGPDIADPHFRTIKIEGKWNEALLTPGLKPRTLSNIHPYAQVLVGPYIYECTKRLKASWSRAKDGIPYTASNGHRWRVHLHYAGADTDTDLSHWATQMATHLFPNTLHIIVSGDDSVVVRCDASGFIRYFEGDATMYDQSESFGPLLFQADMMKHHGMPDVTSDQILSLAGATYVIDYKESRHERSSSYITHPERPMRQTGGSDTSLGNSFIMAVTSTHAYTEPFDNLEDVAANYLFLGLKMKIKELPSFRHCSFLKGHWVVCDSPHHPLWWVPLPSRILKLGKTVQHLATVYPCTFKNKHLSVEEKLCAASRQYIGEVSHGFSFFAETPFLSHFVHTFPLIGPHLLRPDAYSVQASRSPKPQVILNDYFESLSWRYGVTTDSLLEALHLLPTQLFSWTLHPVFSALASTDYG